jgi:hypothetical protein
MRFALALLILLIARAAPAAPIDMGTLTCQDWLDTDDDQQDRMVGWLHGYLAGRSGATTYDVDGRADTAILKGYCHGHPTTGVINGALQWRH